MFINVESVKCRISCTYECGFIPLNWDKLSKKKNKVVHLPDLFNIHIYFVFWAIQAMHHPIQIYFLAGPDFWMDKIKVDLSKINVFHHPLITIIWSLFCSNLSRASHWLRLFIPPWHTSHTITCQNCLPLYPLFAKFHICHIFVYFLYWWKHWWVS